MMVSVSEIASSDSEREKNLGCVKYISHENEGFVRFLEYIEKYIIVIGHDKLTESGYFGKILIREAVPLASVERSG